jgi:hypothetical protein
MILSSGPSRLFTVLPDASLQLMVAERDDMFQDKSLGRDALRVTSDCHLTLTDIICIDILLNKSGD